MQMHPGFLFVRLTRMIRSVQLDAGNRPLQVPLAVEPRAIAARFPSLWTARGPRLIVCEFQPPRSVVGLKRIVPSSRALQSARVSGDTA